MSSARRTAGTWAAVRSTAGDGSVGIVVNGQHVIAEFFPNIRTAEERADAECMQNAVCAAAAPELLASLTMGAQVDTPTFLEWVADRMVHQYGEPDHIDFVLSLRIRAATMRAAIAKAQGGAA